jgi:hypothetical protein
MTENQHSPTPWSLDSFEPISPTCGEWERCTISAACTPGTIARNIAIKDAAFIVTACNSYAALVNALEAIRDMQITPTTDHAEVTALCMSIAKIALAAAEITVDKKV